MIRSRFIVRRQARAARVTMRAAGGQAGRRGAAAHERGAAGRVVRTPMPTRQLRQISAQGRSRWWLRQAKQGRHDFIEWGTGIDLDVRDTP